MSLGTGALRESDPVFYHWPWYYHVPSLGLWVLLAAGLAVPKSNRDRRALLVLIPPLILMLLLGPATRMAGFNPMDLEQFSTMFRALLVGLALLWLNAGYLSRYHSVVSCALSIGLVLLAAGVGALSYGTGQAFDAVLYLLFAVVMSIAFIAALRVARRLTGGRYRPLRFMLYLAVSNALISPVGVLAFVGVVALIDLGMFSGLGGILIYSALIGLIAALCLYAANLPYMLLMFSSPFFRRRFQDWLGVVR